MARVILEYDNLLEENHTLGEMMNWCDSVMDTQEQIIRGMDGLIIIKDEKITNLKLQNEQIFEMFDLVNDQVKKEKKLKWIFIGTTTFVVTLLTLSLL